VFTSKVGSYLAGWLETYLGIFNSRGLKMLSGSLLVDYSL